MKIHALWAWILLSSVNMNNFTKFSKKTKMKNRHYSQPNLLGSWFQRFGRGMYFSFITLTTLGYGDFRPVGWWRCLAAFEAIVGYIFLGVFVYILTSFSETHPYGPEKWMHNYEKRIFALQGKPEEKEWMKDLRELVASAVKQVENDNFDIEILRPLFHSAWWELWDSPSTLYNSILFEEIKSKKSRASAGFVAHKEFQEALRYIAFTLADNQHHFEAFEVAFQLNRQRTLMLWLEGKKLKAVINWLHEYLAGYNHKPMRFLFWVILIGMLFGLLYSKSGVIERN